MMDMEEATSTRADIGNDAIVIGILIGCIAAGYASFKYLDKQWETGKQDAIV